MSVAKWQGNLAPRPDWPAFYFAPFAREMRRPAAPWWTAGGVDTRIRRIFGDVEWVFAQRTL